MRWPGGEVPSSIGYILEWMKKYGPLIERAFASGDLRAARGGVFTNDAHDGFSEYTEIAAPATPAANKVRLYAKDVAGVARLFYKSDDGTEFGPL